MKTIFDAVNELQGSLSNCRHYNYSCTKINYIYISSSSNTSFTDEIQVTCKLVNNNSWVLICEEKEFNALVAEMETNFGKCSVDDVIAYRRATKELLKPESNIYTQEMHDNGELPSAGMKVQLEEDTEFFSCASGEITTLKTNDIVYVVSVGKRSDNGNDVITVMQSDSGFCTINPDYIKPITPPTPLIDGKAYEYTDVNIEQGIFCSADDCFHSPGWTVCASDCTNIKPLTVKGE